jgi:hypothetical protein
MTSNYWHIDAGCDGQLSDHFQKFAPSRLEGLTFNKSNANPETLIIMSILGLSKRDTSQKNCQVRAGY